MESLNTNQAFISESCSLLTNKGAHGIWGKGVGNAVCSRKSGKIALGRWVWTLEGAGRSRAGAEVWGERVRRL